MDDWAIVEIRAKRNSNFIMDYSEGFGVLDGYVLSLFMFVYYPIILMDGGWSEAIL